MAAAKSAPLRPLPSAPLGVAASASRWSANKWPCSKFPGDIYGACLPRSLQTLCIRKKLLDGCRVVWLGMPLAQSLARRSLGAHFAGTVPFCSVSVLEHNRTLFPY